MITILQNSFRSLLSKLSNRTNNLSGSTSSDCVIGAEAPIANSKGDLLRRNTYAERIAKILMAPEPKVGRVFAIRGGWGYGKSSLKNLIIAHIEQHHKHGYVDFNPWQWGDSDTIVRELFSQIADVLGGEYSTKEKKRAEKFRSLGNLLSGASDPLKQASKSEVAIASLLTNLSLITVAASIGFKESTPKIVAIIVCILSGLSFFAKYIGALLSKFGLDKSNDSLGKLRASLVDQLREMERPVVVFVDDLDRLEPMQIQLLLAQVKTNANLPNIVFVLLFQANIVEAALDPIANGNGRAFLEKIVQANFDLPAVPISAVHNIFDEEIRQLLGNYASEANGFSSARWGNVSIDCIFPMIRNLRDIRRLISSIASHLPMHSGGQVFEVNVIDFIILEAVRVFEPVLYSALYERKNLLIQAFQFNKEHSKSEVQRLTQIVADERQSIVQNVVKQLFPTVEWALGGTNYGPISNKRWLIEKRVCSAQYFPRYFELQTPEGDISDSRMLEVIQTLDSKEYFAASITCLEEEDLLASFVYRLDDLAETIPVQHAPIFVPAMFEIAQKFVFAGNSYTFDSAWAAAWRATNSYLRKIPPEQKRELVVQALRQSQGMTIAAMLIQLSDSDNSDGRIRDPALDIESVNALKSEWLHQIREMAKNTESLLSELDLANLLYRWRDYTGSLQEPRLWVKQVADVDDQFATLIFRVMSVGRVRTSGTYVSAAHYSFDEKLITDFIGLDFAKAKCDAIRLTESDERAVALRILSEHLIGWIRWDARASSDDISQ